MRKILLFLTTTITFSLLAGTIFAQNAKEQSFVTTDMAVKISNYCQYNELMRDIFVRANLTYYNRESDRILRTLDTHLDYAEKFLLSLYNHYGLEKSYFALKNMGFTIQETDIVEDIWENQKDKLNQQADTEKSYYEKKRAETEKKLEEQRVEDELNWENDVEYAIADPYVIDDKKETQQHFDNYIERQQNEEQYRQQTSHPNSGNGTNFNLAGRSLATTPPKPEYNSKSEGKVIVEIRVDRNGNVVSASPGKAGTTTNDPILREAAKNAALKTKFNSAPNAAEIQVGTITYTFVNM